MSISDQELDIRIRAADEASAVMAKAGKSVEDFAARTKKAQKSVNGEGKGGGAFGIFGRFEEIEKDSKRSGVKQFGELLAGGAAGAGVVLTARVLAEAAGKAREVANGLYDGQLRAGELFEKINESLPVWGEVWKAGRGIHAAAEDTAAAIAKGLGFSQKTVDWWTSGETLLARSVNHARALAELEEARTKSLEQEHLVGLVGAARERELARQENSVTQRGLNQRAAAIDKEKDPEAQTKLGAIAVERRASEDKLRERQRQIDHEDGVAREARAGETEQRITDIIGAADEARLRERGKLAEAEAAQVRRDGQARINQIEHQAVQEAEKTNDRHEQESIMRRAGREEAAVRAATEQGAAMVVRKAQEEEAEQRLATEQRINQFNIAALETQAQMGNVLAGREAERLKILEETKKQRLELAEIMHRESTSEADKAKAAKALEKLDKDAAARLKANILARNPDRISGEVAANESGSIGAAGFAARDAAMIAQQKALEKAAEDEAAKLKKDLDKEQPPIRGAETPSPIAAAAPTQPPPPVRAPAAGTSATSQFPPPVVNVIPNPNAASNTAAAPDALVTPAKKTADNTDQMSKNIDQFTRMMQQLLALAQKSATAGTPLFSGAA